MPSRTRTPATRRTSARSTRERLVIDAGAQAVLTGNCGFEARRMFANAGVKLFQGVPGTVEEAVEQFKAGRLLEVSAPGIREPVEAGVARDWEI